MCGGTDRVPQVRFSQAEPRQYGARPHGVFDNPCDGEWHQLHGSIETYPWTAGPLTYNLYGEFCSTGGNHPCVFFYQRDQHVTLTEGDDPYHGHRGKFTHYQLNGTPALHGDGSVTVSGEYICQAGGPGSRESMTVLVDQESGDTQPLEVPAVCDQQLQRWSETLPPAGTPLTAGPAIVRVTYMTMSRVGGHHAPEYYRVELAAPEPSPTPSVAVDARVLVRRYGATLTGVVSCGGGSRYFIEGTLKQGGRTGTIRASGPCGSNGEVRGPVIVRGGFVPGEATALVRVTSCAGKTCATTANISTVQLVRRR